MLPRPRLLLATLAAAVLTIIIPATPSSAHTAAVPPTEAQLATTAVTVQYSAATAVRTVRIVTGHTSWGLAARYCGNGALHTTGVSVRSPVGAVRDPARIWPGDTATITCANGPAAPAGPTPGVTAPRTGWVSPLASYALTSCFGRRSSTNSYHRGLDMAAPGGTTIRAAAAGTVTRVGWIWGGYGISTVISHGNGTWTHYAHQSTTLVRVGQRVAAGQVIGRVGHTGFVIASRYGDGSHLHFEVATASGILRAQINPAPFLRARGVVVKGCYS